jgi:hypothetical protein
MVIIRRASGHDTPNLCFYIRWDLRVAWWFSVCSGHEMSTYYFSCSGGTGTVSIRRALGHVTLNLHFSIWWDLQVIVHFSVSGHDISCTIFYVWVGLVRFP